MANKIGSLFESDVFDGEDGPYVMLDGQPIFLDDNQIQAMTPIKPSTGPLAPTTPKVDNVVPGMFEKVFSGAEPDLKSDTPFFDLARQARINRQSNRSLNRGEPFVDQRTLPNPMLDRDPGVSNKAPLSRPLVRDSKGNPVLNSKGEARVFSGAAPEPKQKSYNSFAEFFGK